MKKPATMTIPAPKARPGDTITVLNYRRKPAAWEAGTVKQVSYSTSHWSDDFRWSYGVWIARPVKDLPYGRQRGGGYYITVNDEAIAAAGVRISKADEVKALEWLTARMTIRDFRGVITIGTTGDGKIGLWLGALLIGTGSTALEAILSAMAREENR